MTKPIETLEGADAAAFRAALKPHVGAVLEEDGFTREALDEAVLDAGQNGAAAAQAVVDTIPTVMAPIVNEAEGYRDEALNAVTGIPSIIQPYVTAAQSASASAAAYGALPLEQSNYLLRVTAESQIVRPTLVLSRNVQVNSDSTGFGVGTTSPFSWPSQFAALTTGGFAVVNNSVSGETSQQATARVVALSPTAKADTLFYSAGLNDMNTLVSSAVGGNRRDWASAGVTKANILAAKAAVTGPFCAILALRQDTSNPGQKNGADFSYHYRDMIETLGADAIDASRYMRAMGELSGPDQYNVAAGGVPISKQGRGGGATFTINNAPFITTAGVPGDLSYDDGQVAWNSTGLAWYRKIGNAGTGNWQTVDGKHPSNYGYADEASITRDWKLGETGQGAPFAPPQQFRCAYDIVAGGLVGRVAIRTATSAFGSAVKAEIVAGNDGGVFAIDPFGRVRRSNQGALQRKIYTLWIRLTGSNGYKSLGIVDVHVGRASTQLKPQKILIPAPICVGGMEGHGLSSTGKVLSGAVWMMSSSFESGGFLLNWSNGASGSQAKFFVRLPVDGPTGTGKLSLFIYNAADVVIGRAASRGQFDGGVGIPRNTWGWLTWAIDLGAGTFVAYWNDTALIFPTGSVAMVDETIPLGDMSPLFLNGRSLAGADTVGASPFVGGVGYGALWTDYIDWSNSARRRELFNADGTPAIENSTGTINGLAAAMVWWQGEPVDLAWGRVDGNLGPLVQVNAAALSTMTIA